MSFIKVRLSTLLLRHAAWPVMVSATLVGAFGTQIQSTVWQHRPKRGVLSPLCRMVLTKGLTVRPEAKIAFAARRRSALAQWNFIRSMPS